MSYRVTFDAEKCVGCYACQIACLDAHHEPEETDARDYRTVRKSRKNGFEKVICPGCTHCGKCMEACPNHAIYRDEIYGLVLVDKTLCTGCRTCASVCPLELIRYDADGKMEKCDGCIERRKAGREPACVRTCYAGALILR